MKTTVRKGRVGDGVDAIDVLHRSISELCGADHHGDERRIAAWLSNKTEQAWTAWLAREGATVLVAENGDEIVGVGMMDRHGEILLNYVQPAARFSGVSKAILESLENAAREMDLQMCFLESTKTARSFYKRCGYVSATEASLKLEKVL